MRYLTQIAIAVIVTTGIVTVAHFAIGATRKTSEVESARWERACAMADGGWTTIDCSNVAAASSAQLTANARWIIQCGVDSYIRQGNTAASDDASATDGWIPAEEWWDFVTDDTNRYISCLNIGSDSDCRYFECE